MAVRVGDGRCSEPVLALIAALSLSACGGSSSIDRSRRSANGGSSGTDGASSGSSGGSSGKSATGASGSGASGAGMNGAGTSGAATGRNEPPMLPAPDAVDVTEPASDDAPLLLARDQLEPIAIAVDDDNVYWLNRGTFEARIKDEWSNGDASVMKCARKGCGGQPTALASQRWSNAQQTPAFAVAAGYLYWTDWPDAHGEGALVRCRVAGCDPFPEPVLSRPVRALAADDTRLYATLEGPEVLTCVADDCEASAAELWAVDSMPVATDVAVDASGVYWTTFALDGVLTCPASGCDDSPTVIMPSQSGLISIGQLALDAENVYFADGNSCDTGGLVTCKKTGCPQGPTWLADGLTPLSMVTDGAHLYFGEQASLPCGHEVGSVRRCDVHGCGNAPETIALGLTTPGAVAVDAEYVFVADITTGAVWRLPKGPRAD